MGLISHTQSKDEKNMLYFTSYKADRLNNIGSSISGTEDEVENPLRMVISGQISSLFSSVHFLHVR